MTSLYKHFNKKSRTESSVRSRPLKVPSNLHTEITPITSPKNVEADMNYYEVFEKFAEKQQLKLVHLETEAKKAKTKNVTKRHSK